MNKQQHQQKEAPALSREAMDEKKTKKAFPVEGLQPMDILSGRDGKPLRTIVGDSHPGTQLFKDTINKYMPMYHELSRHGRAMLVQDVMRMLLTQYGCRFVRLDRRTGQIVPMKDRQIRDKVSFSLRSQSRNFQSTTAITEHGKVVMDGGRMCPPLPLMVDSSSLSSVGSCSSPRTVTTVAENQSGTTVPLKLERAVRTGDLPSGQVQTVKNAASIFETVDKTSSNKVQNHQALSSPIQTHINTVQSQSRFHPTLPPLINHGGGVASQVTTANSTVSAQEVRTEELARNALAKWKVTREQLLSTATPSNQQQELCAASLPKAPQPPTEQPLSTSSIAAAAAALRKASNGDVEGTEQWLWSIYFLTKVAPKLNQL